MIRLIFTIILMPVFVGCSKSSTAPTGPATPAGLPGYVRPGDPTITSEHTKAISITKTHLETTYQEPVDAYYRVTDNDDGFSVHVEYVTGYDDAGQPILVLGGHCTVVISKEWKVVKTLPGA